MRYQTGEQTAAPGAALLLETSQIRSAGEIRAEGSQGLSLGPGEYLLSFTADAELADAGTLGAVLALNGAPLPYTACAIPTELGGKVRVKLETVLALSATGVVTAVNHTENELLFRNPVLVAVKLA
jgi:hypothetical protein